MQTLTLVLELALLFGPGCESGCSVLLGADTPRPGVYTARPMDLKAYGFQHDGAGGIYAIHPTWNEQRLRALDQPPIRRRTLTDGCINMHPDDFARLPKRGFKLEIVR